MLLIERETERSCVCVLNCCESARTLSYRGEKQEGGRRVGKKNVAKKKRREPIILFFLVQPVTHFE